MPERRPAAAEAAREQAWNQARLRGPPSRPRWRTWRYRAPAVVLGAGQAELADAAAVGAAAQGVAVLRRRAGGGAVLVGPWMLGLSVVLPAAHAHARGGPLPAYRWLGEALAAALTEMVQAPCRSVPPGELAPGERAARDWACFGAMAPWEVACGGRKICGLAQVRTRDAVLLVGGVLLQAPDWELLCRVLGQPASEARRLRGATCDCASLAPGGMDAGRLHQGVRTALARSLRQAPA
ncbi:MAG: ligase [Betaproteobacteria bacterium]|nr:ligase [Betaproteobacteria bacterium]